MNAVNPVPAYRDGRLPVVSSSFRTPSRPSHNGSDIMYPRLPKDGGPEGKHLLPALAPRFFMPNGVPTLAFADGIVDTSKDIGTGGYIVLNHEGGYQSQYMHLRNRKVKTGQTVRAGQPIATISYSPTDFHLNHLHFQLRQNGSLLDPEPILTGLPVLPMPTNWWPLLILVGGVWLYARSKRV